MNRRIGADPHHRGIAEEKFACPSENEVEPKRAGSPYEPRQQIAAEIGRVCELRRGTAERKQESDDPAVGCNRRRRAVGGLCRIKVAGLPEQDWLRTARNRGGRSGRAGE